MQTLILAGGFGTRLKSIVKDIPKPMADIAGRPFLYYLVTELFNYNIMDIVFLTGYKSEIIEGYFSHTRLVKYKFSKEETPLGTAGAIFNIWDELDDEFLVINGDTFFDVDFTILTDFADKKKSTIALRYSSDLLRYGFVDIDDNYLVSKFIEKGDTLDRIDGYINAGIYLLQKNDLKSFYLNWDRGFLSLETSIFPMMKNLYGLPMGGMFIDIGVPDDYSNAQSLIPKRVTEPLRPALFLDRDNLLIEDEGYTFGTDLIKLDKVDKDIKLFNQLNNFVIVISNQSGVARGKFSEHDVNITNNTVREIYLKHDMKINDFFYCPYHIDGLVPGYSVHSLARKPNPGMILQACEKFKIDLKKSKMIGDNALTDTINLPYLYSVIK